jgi:hypothetical protein
MLYTESGCAKGLEVSHQDICMSKRRKGDLDIPSTPLRIGSLVSFKERLPTVAPVVIRRRAIATECGAYTLEECLNASDPIDSIARA